MMASDHSLFQFIFIYSKPWPYKVVRWKEEYSKIHFIQNSLFVSMYAKVDNFQSVTERHQVFVNSVWLPDFIDDIQLLWREAVIHSPLTYSSFTYSLPVSAGNIQEHKEFWGKNYEFRKENNAALASTFDAVFHLLWKFSSLTQHRTLYLPM